MKKSLLMHGKNSGSPGLTRSSSSENGILDNYNRKDYFQHTEENNQREIFGIYCSENLRGKNENHS